ncbi:hypothetical protein H0H81_012293 [Sphagnurus paluster]|uniref:Uncharacterized protein n=1 Tax=Sphagnurus paluster TaxID=117069 RepID=A0A9P7FUM1_9AGAR|nr:hypothetical protein H0H81_012293 [Sphagnurus paluster]
MGQYFTILNLDNSLPVKTVMGGKFGECFWSMHHAKIEDALWRPPGERVTTKSYSEPKEKGQSSFLRGFHDSENAANHMASAFYGLSNEVIDLIYKKFDNLEEVILLAVTCQRSYEISRRHLERWVQQLFVVSWAGDRLICIGDYAQMDDLPPGMLTDEEREYLADRCEHPADDNEQLTDDCASRENDHDADETSLWEKLGSLQLRHPKSAIRQIRINDPNSSRYSDWGLYLFYMTKRAMSIMGKDTKMGLLDDGDREALSELLTIDRKTLYTHASDWYPTHALRNLTKKEYVRGDAIERVRREPDARAQRLDNLSFNHILAARFTWSSDPSLSMSYEGPLHRGVWAGHRFDVVEIGCLYNGQESLDGWKDVSEEVIAEVREIAKADFQ